MGWDGGRYTTERGGGHLKLYPYKKRRGHSLSYFEGGGGGAKSVHSLKGGGGAGARNVLPCLEGCVQK